MEHLQQSLSDKKEEGRQEPMAEETRYLKTVAKYFEEQELLVRLSLRATKGRLNEDLGCWAGLREWVSRMAFLGTSHDCVG